MLLESRSLRGPLQSHCSCNRMSICSKRSLGEVHPVIFLFGKMVSSCSKRDAYEAHVAFRQGREKTRNKLK